MKITSLKIVLAQIALRMGAIEHNAQTIIATAQRARHKMQADWVVFPELALTGYPPDDLLIRPHTYDRLNKALDHIMKASHTADVNLIIGYPRQHHNRLYNAAAVIQKGQMTHIYHKQCLAYDSVFNEKRYFTPGDGTPVLIDIGNTRIGILICKDLWKTQPIKHLVAAGAHWVITLNASPFFIDKPQKRERILTAQARQHHCGLIYVNTVGGQDELVFDGGSLVIDTQGRVQQRAAFFKEDWMIIHLAQTLHQAPAAIVSNTSDHKSLIPLPSLETLIYEALTVGIRDYCNHNHLKHIFVGLSGGIDSALTLTLAVDALGPERVHAVFMPSEYTNPQHKIDIEQQTKTLGTSLVVLPIHVALKAFLDTLTPLGDEISKITRENLQARCRGVLLMALANQQNGMVLCTSNQSELAVGYSTLYGDTVGGFAALKNVPKTMVYRLARYRNQCSTAIPEAIFHKAPSAELSPEQTDQDTLPPYPILDSIIERYVRQKHHPAQMIADGLDPDQVDSTIQRIERSEYKRRQSPPGVCLTLDSFGRARQYPITSAYQAEPRLILNKESV